MTRLRRMYEVKGYGDTPTRVWVDAFVKTWTKEAKLALYFFIPPKYRGRPTTFVSHSWDGMLVHLLRAVEHAMNEDHLLICGDFGRGVIVPEGDTPNPTPRNSVEGRSELGSQSGSDGPERMSLGSSGHLSLDAEGLSSVKSHIGGSSKTGSKGSPVFWIDGFAITQHPIRNCSSVCDAHPEVRQIGDIINQISRTLLVLPGAGEPALALRPCLRSWCLYEIANTPLGALTVELGAAHSDMALHKRYRQAINTLSVHSATATFNDDKVMVDQLLDEKFGSHEAVDTMLKKVLLEVFHHCYAEVYCHIDPAVPDIYCTPKVPDGSRPRLQSEALHAPSPADLSEFDRVSGAFTEIRTERATSVSSDWVGEQDEVSKSSYDPGLSTFIECTAWDSSV